jgi:uncharacterized damage-inducible protein DinB
MELLPELLKTREFATNDIMLKQTLQTLYRRDLEKLRQEIEAYKSEQNLWSIDKDVANSAGNLTLHLIGNLNHFIGAEIGKSGYVRQRDLEFSTKNTPRNELLRMIDDTIIVVENAIESMNDEDFTAIYPINVFGNEMTTEWFLIHLTTHLAYHLGQINFHRRLLD